MRYRRRRHNNYRAISTSKRARYEYTSGDIRYLRFPANIMSALDFLRNEAMVYKRVSTQSFHAAGDTTTHHLA